MEKRTMGKIPVMAKLRNSEDKDKRNRLLKRAVVIVLLLLFIFYFIPPSSWLIPDEPMVQGSSGMFMLGTPEIEPRWSWLSARGWAAVPALKESLKYGTPYARMGCARLLGLRKNPALVPDLAEALLNGNDDMSGLRSVAADALVQTGGAEARKALEDAVEKYSEREAIQALGEMQDKQSIPVLLRMLKAKHGSRDWDDHDLAVEALKKICGGDIGNQVLRWLQDGTLSLDEISMFMMSRNFDRRALTPALLSQFHSSTDHATREKLIFALGFQGGPEVVPVLIECLGPNTDIDHLDVIKMLLRIHSKDAVPGLLDLAARCEQRISYPDAMDTEFLDTIYALGSLEDPRAVPFLFHLMTTGNGRWVREEATLALSRILHINLGLVGNAAHYDINLARHVPLVRKIAEKYLKDMVPGWSQPEEEPSGKIESDSKP